MLSRSGIDSEGLSGLRLHCGSYMGAGYCWVEHCWLMTMQSMTLPSTSGVCGELRR